MAHFDSRGKMMSTRNLKCTSPGDKRCIFDRILHAPQAITERIVNLSDGMLIRS